MSSPHDPVAPLVQMRGWQLMLGIFAGLFALLFALVSVFLLLGLLFTPGDGRTYAAVGLAIYGPPTLIYGWMSFSLLRASRALGQVSILGDEAVEDSLERLLAFWRGAAVVAVVAVAMAIGWAVLSHVYADQVALIMAELVQNISRY